MKIIINLILICFTSGLYAQNYKVHSVIKKEQNVVSEYRETNISVSDEFIIIRNYKNNYTEDLIMKIEKTEQKLYQEANCVWFYCVSVEKDMFNNNYRKGIFIYDKVGKNMLFANFISEVDVSWIKFLLQ
jgi:hypothetical protein